MSILSRLRRPVDILVIESTPLHTERPDWAAHAPEQVAAACKRGADFIGLTEFRNKVPEMTSVAHAHGYDVFGSHHDAHRQVAILVKRSLKVVHHTDVVVNNNHRVGVTISWHGRLVTAFETHWENGSIEQSKALAEAMAKASGGSDISFGMGDGNPRPHDQSRPASEPGKTLKAHGCPTVWQELDEYPQHLGVNIICRNVRDTSVTTRSAVLHAPLGSDHYPATARFGVKRRFFRS